MHIVLFCSHLTIETADWENVITIQNFNEIMFYIKTQLKFSHQFDWSHNFIICHRPLELAFCQGYSIFVNSNIAHLFRFFFIAPFVFKLICVEFYFLLGSVVVLRWSCKHESCWRRRCDGGGGSWCFLCMLVRFLASY